MLTNYQAMKARCNADFTQECVQYFLTLPKGDLGVTQSRADFAGDYCRNNNNLDTVPCNLLCRDDPATCLANRRKFCSNVTLEMVESGDKRYTRCACYLTKEEYKRQIERIRKILGDTTANQIESSINSPYCFYGPCAESEAGLSSRTGGCQTLTGCLQSVEIGENKNVIVSNVCTIINNNTELPVPPLPTPPIVIPEVNYTWIWWIVAIIIILLIILTIYLVYRSRKHKSSISPLQLALLSNK